MAKKVISYKLTSEGTIPDFVEDGGYYPSAPTWQEMVLVGVSKDGATLPAEVDVYETEADLLAYLESYLEDGTQAMAGGDIEFIVADQPAIIFAKLA